MCYNIISTNKMKTHHFFSTTLLTLFIFKSFTLTTPNLTTDESALLAFKNTGVSAAFANNWSTNSSVCSWTGITCGAKHRRVTALNVSGLALAGNLSPHLGNLSFLRSLDISSNDFSGSVPSELSKLRRLEYLNMGVNNFSGGIPPWFEALSQLQYLNLKNNSFSGRIPPSLFNSSSILTINLIYNMISGELPNDMCSISSKLKYLYLIGNQIEGEIPKSIYKCRELEDLRLDVNNINGQIPSEIGSLSMLSFLSLFSNKFRGSIPEEFGNLTSLQNLDLGMNNLQGPIPKQFGNMTSLINLDLSSNRLTGELPKELGNLPNLEVLGVPFNELNGSIPSSIFNISTLQLLGLQQNNLTGNLPSTMGLNLPNLQGLYLFYNKLSGRIPASINNASMLNNIELNRNSFTGPIPDLGGLRLLQHLKLWENDLSGAESPSGELTFLSSLTRSPYLVSVEVSDNPRLSGVLPASMGNFSTTLGVFMASWCDIRGRIPSEIGNLSNLLTLQMSDNQLSGFVPETLGGLTKLQRLYLGNNRLEVDIPRIICRMTNLGELNLSTNMITGPLHECLGELESMRSMALASNQLNSSIPLNFWDLPTLLRLDLNSNNLNGQISSRIGDLNTIEELDLSSNRFSGEIPVSIDKCQSLQLLLLSNNSLSGSIPKSLENLLSLEFFDVSYNELEGEIPNGGPFGNFTARSFVNNSGLCGVERFGVPACPKPGRSNDRLARLVKYIVPPFVSVIVLVVVVVVYIRRRRHKKMSPQVEGNAWKTDWKRISYLELERGTSSFSETSLLGRGSFGSVFKGILSDGLNVAVKVFNLDLEGATKSFDVESEILSSIRHRNLLRILGCCVNVEFRALILAYMPNGNLEKWLHSESYCLDLIDRVKIAIDVALALEYLHHHHTFVVVHCDIKPSNVLLDEDMVAHVGDFGMSKLFDEGQVMVQTETLATIGYAAPEYGSGGTISTKGDVYSYGILLLEMFTQKKPTDDIFSGTMSLKEWVEKALREGAMREIMAPSLLSREDRHFDSKTQCVSSIFDLAMKCLAKEPEERINMVEVVAALQKTKAKVTIEGASHGRTGRATA